MSDAALTVPAAGRSQRFLRRFLTRSRMGVFGGTIVLAMVIMAVFAPLIAPADPLRQNLRLALSAPGENGFILGSDELGRDTLSRIIYGTRMSLTVGFFGLTFGMLLGLPLGLLAGFYGGRFDAVTMRLMDVILAFPRLLLAIIVIATQGIGFWSIVFAIAIPDMPQFARIVRSRTLSLKENDYVVSARAIGAGDLRLLARHLLPNVIGPTMVQATFSLAAAVLVAGGLSFLGLGIQPPTPEWGSMLAASRTYIRTAPHLAIFPGIAFGLLILGINLLGDALSQAIDPRIGFLRR